ncbi:NAD(P)-dependent oxidoreductase [Alsobacter sp. SYSU M60028]|uniref:NAD(P)-dependent oxidoreductase n=1 Tax=Alsobacter ponti TaxID=2962936 RepID=A0ABT1L7H0_9HYPH|nr:NAD-dependent epimerase/dehydratase family protein [Alsobacter ponti]MCP8936943.1 NAD(P)-dependent oxidoreductase [Alsobacter ponti]
MVRRALIGHTGFVGSNLDAPDRFAARYNSGSIQDIEGETFDEIVCAGVSAKKWLANKQPDEDWAAIAALIRRLETVRAKRFVLISTIDVYPDPSVPADEDVDPSGEENHAYGRHRLKLEEWARGRFEDSLVVRLPALFGPNLAKNALFDLMHGNMVEAINPAAEFQWYPVRRLWEDIEVARDAGLGLVNLFTEPVSMRAVVDRFFPGAAVGPAREPAPRYRLRTRHAPLYHGRDGYMMDAASVFDEMGRFVGEG